MTFRRRLRAGYTSPSSGGIDYTIYNYTDAADPLFTTKHGYGNLPNNRIDLRVAGNDAGQINGTPFKRILVDGTTAALNTNAPHYQNVADIAAAKAAFAVGDWILMPGGTSQSVVFGELYTGSIPFNGLSAQNPAVLGTFDPADKYNDAKINTLKYTVDATGKGAGSIIYCFRPIQYFCLVNFNFLAGAADALQQANFLVDGGAPAAQSGRFIVFENCSFDGVNPNVAGGLFTNASFGWQNIPITSLTNPGSGTTARAFTANTYNLTVGAVISIIGASPAAYSNWGAAITAINPGVSFDYIFAGNGGVSATGTITYQTRFLDVPDGRCHLDVTFRYCGIMYAADTTTGRGGALHVNAWRRFRMEACTVFHCGWARGTTRTTPGAEDAAGVTSTSLTSVGTLATFACTDTRMLRAGDSLVITGATPSAYNGTYTISNVVLNTSFQYTFAGGVGAASVQGNYGVYNAALPVGPDQYKHNLYIEDQGDDGFFGDLMNGWDSANLKFTGGNIRLQNLVTYRNPIAYINNSWGNVYGGWANGSTFKDDNSITVHSDEIRTIALATPGWRNWGPQVVGATVGSYVKNALLLNQTNRSTTNLKGIGITSGGTLPYTSTVTVDGAIIPTWGGQSGSATPDAFTSVTYQNCVWPIATSGSNTQFTSMSAGYQSKANAAELLNATTLIAAFPQYLGSVTVVPGDDIATEVNMLEYMCANPFIDGLRSWATLSQYHYRYALA